MNLRNQRDAFEKFITESILHINVVKAVESTFLFKVNKHFKNLLLPRALCHPRSRRVNKVSAEVFVFVKRLEFLEGIVFNLVNECLFDLQLNQVSKHNELLFSTNKVFS